MKAWRALLRPSIEGACTRTHDVYAARQRMKPGGLFSWPSIDVTHTRDARTASMLETGQANRQEAMNMHAL